MSFRSPLVWIAIINRDLNICIWPLILPESAPPAHRLESKPLILHRRHHHLGWNRSTSGCLQPLESTQNIYLGPRCHTAIENRQQNRKIKARTQASILLLNFHPNLLRISITVISKRWQFFFRAFSSSSLESSDQHLVRHVHLKVT